MSERGPRLGARQIWAMPVFLTVTSVLAIVVGLLADGAVDALACIGVALPIAITSWHVGRTVRVAKR